MKAGSATASGDAVRKFETLLVTLGAVMAILALPRAVDAWHGWPYAPGAWAGPYGGPAPVAAFPSALPFGSRFYYPPGIPLTYSEPASGTMYCFSQPYGFYYVCGYSPPTRDVAEIVYRMPPGAALPPREQGLPPPSGVLLFRLPRGAEAEVDGYPVGLSGGLGITSVSPGRHRVVVRISGAETEHAVMVNPHSILTVTPAAIIPNGP
jgi:hypothetical protein